MLTLVDITNYLGNTLQLPLLDSSAGYVVKEIDGLDPVTATLTSSSMAQFDGAQFQNAQRGARNITMKLGLEPNYTSNSVKSLRDALYDYLLPKANINLGFYIDDVLSFIAAGQVESFENDMFSADPEIDISIICYDPDFYGPESQTVSAVGVDDSSTETINYDGTSEAGFIFTTTYNRSANGFILNNTTPDGVTHQFKLEGFYESGDIVTINTIPGSRSATLTRDDQVFPILFSVGLDPDWIMLQKGINYFQALGTPGIPYTLVYTPKYGAL